MSAEGAFARAAAAAPGWAARPLEERVAIIRRFGDLVARDRDRLAEILTDDMGKPITQSRNELAGVGPRVDYFVDEVPRVLQPTTVYDDGELVEQIGCEPLGVVANISAWNYPWFVGMNVQLPALLTGNAVLYKPSELVPRTGEAITELLYAAGVPEDVFVLVSGGPAAGAALLEQPVDGVFFTGSYATGRRIAEAVAGRMIRLQLELGGKDPVYVTDDVDLGSAAASLADGAFYNNGQSCCSVERIYVHEAVYEAFVEAFVAVVEGFVVGDPHDERTYLGPLARPEQLEVLEAQVADAVAKGAVVRTGGHRLSDRPGAWFAPTVITDVTNDMDVMRVESFGPIIGIGVVASDDEAVALMNDTDYGLTAAVYTRDEQRARRLLARLDVGSAYWNCCDRVSPRLPWSGRHHSGIGATLGTAGILACVQPKAWHLRR
ncbi:aldehyde dehydrogenase family protein [Rhabdothermincola sp.]|uniref:aldehyde dehydrogenase family protein n=1 Tax=Rhabdothermincola sp. TaxID=2820405 RepID=UPI002FE3C2A2